MSVGGLSGGFAFGALERAQVLGLVDRKAILLVQGQVLGVSISRSGLVEGQQLQGRFLRMDSGQVQFDIQSVSQPDAPTSGRIHLGSFFESHGIKPSEINFLVGYKAMQMGQPLTQDLFQQIARFAGLLPEQNEASIQSLILAISSRLPINRSVLRLARQQISSDKTVVSLLRGLLGLKSGQSLSREQITGLRGYFPELSESGFNLRRYFDRSGIDIESQLLRRDGSYSPQFMEQEVDGPDPFKKLIKDLMSFQKLFRTEAEVSEQILQIPYLSDGKLHEMTLVIHRKNAEDRDGAEQFQGLSIYLDLTRLGSLALNFTRHGNHLSTTIRSENMDVVGYLEARKNELVEVLKDVPDLNSVSVRIIKASVVAPDPSFIGSAIEPQKIDVSV